MYKIIVLLALILPLGMLDGMAESLQGVINGSTLRGRGIGSFLTSGVLKEKLTPAGYLETYLFKDKSSKWIHLKGNIVGINAFLASEFPSRDEAKRFVRGELINLLICSLGPDCWILNRKLVTIVSKAKAESPFESNKKLLRYAVDPGFWIDGDKWSLRTFILTAEGAVEKWEFSGKIFPLAVLRYRSESLAAEGTYAPLKMM